MKKVKSDQNVWIFNLFDFVYQVEMEQKKFLELKEKYRFLPLLIVFLLTTIPRNVPSEKDKLQILSIRDNILEMYVKDYSWLEDLVSMMGDEKETSKNSSIEVGNPPTDNDIRKATMSNLFITIYETLCLVNRLAAIFRIKFELWC